MVKEKEGAHCPHFKPRGIFEPEKCWYWEDKNPHWPSQCKHPAVVVCETRGLRLMPRPDSDDDGYPD
jgi:hypothetical protein